MRIRFARETATDWHLIASGDFLSTPDESDWDLRSSDLYCAECEDYVHHPVAERVVAGQHVLNDLPASLRAHVPGCGSCSQLIITHYFTDHFTLVASPRKPVGSSALSIEDVGGVTENLDREQ